MSHANSLRVTAVILLILAVVCEAFRYGGLLTLAGNMLTTKWRVHDHIAKWYGQSGIEAPSKPALQRTSRTGSHTLYFDERLAAS